MKYIEDELEVELVLKEDGTYLEFEWRDVISYEGYYLVSNYGHVKTVGRLVNCKNGQRKMVDKIKNQNKTGNYLLVQLSKDRVNTSVTVHKLVYEAFNGILPDKLNIDHIDRNPDNNTVLNLRAVTKSQNSMNRGSLKGSASSYKGVHKHPDHWKWRAASHESQGVIHIGYFELEGDAALAYNEYIVKARGLEFSVLNDLSNHNWDEDAENAQVRKFLKSKKKGKVELTTDQDKVKEGV